MAADEADRAVRSHQSSYNLFIGMMKYGAIISIIVALIVFTPLKRFIPGYSDHAVKLNAYRSAMKADSLGTRLRVQEMYVNNLRAVLSGVLESPAQG